MRNESRGPWYLFSGLIIGLVLGIFYAWVISPVQYVDTTPESMRPEFKDQYRSLVAQAYQKNNDLGRARQRLALLNESAPAAVLSAQARDLRADEGETREVLALEQLAAALRGPQGQTAQAQIAETTAAAPLTPEPAATGTLSVEEMVQTATPLPPTPRATQTLRPSNTPQAGLSAPFELRAQDPICDNQTSPGLMEIEVVDASGTPLAGVKITITWAGGEDFFYTGLKNPKNSGYADYELKPGVIYTLRVGESQPVGNIQTADCDGSTGGLKLRFGQ